MLCCGLGVYTLVITSSYPASAHEPDIRTVDCTVRRPGSGRRGFDPFLRREPRFMYSQLRAHTVANTDRHPPGRASLVLVPEYKLGEVRLQHGQKTVSKDSLQSTV